MARDNPEMPFAVTEPAVGSGPAARQVMLITPTRAMTVGRKRIDDLRHSTGVSRVERWLIEQARQRGAIARIVLFRAVNDAGERLWQFDPALSEADLEEGGLVMCRALLPFHRRLMANGVVLIVHTDWGLRECYAMRSGVQKALENLNASPDSDATREADRWLLSHMLLHAALDTSHVLKTLLPVHLPMVERRWPRVRELIARVPASAID